MRLPETENPNYQIAFKRGYRHALESKPVFSMPSDFRQDPKLRHYFEMGWQQANDALSEQSKTVGKPNWKNRSIWFVFMVISGLLTAKLMISNIEQEQQALQEKINPTANVSPEKTVISPEQLNTLRLLNQDAYADLSDSLQAFEKPTRLAITPVFASDLTFENDEIYSVASGKSYRDTRQIPKYERTLKTALQISAPNETELVLRWVYAGEIIQQQTVLLTKGLNSIESQQAMTSSRQGNWRIELLEQQKVIYRQEFIYGSITQ